MRSIVRKDTGEAYYGQTGGVPIDALPLTDLDLAHESRITEGEHLRFSMPVSVGGRLRKKSRRVKCSTKARRSATSRSRRRPFRHGTAAMPSPEQIAALVAAPVAPGKYREFGRDEAEALINYHRSKEVECSENLG
jgi:hypothetical protein